MADLYYMNDGDSRLMAPNGKSPTNVVVFLENQGYNIKKIFSKNIADFENAREFRNYTMICRSGETTVWISPVYILIP